MAENPSLAKKIIVEVSLKEDPPGEFHIVLNPPEAETITLAMNNDGSDADEIEWQCKDGHLEVRFNQQSVRSRDYGASDLFGDAEGSYGQPRKLPVAPARPPLREAARPQPHKYHLIVTTESGNVASLDPTIIVVRPRHVG